MKWMPDYYVHRVTDISPGFFEALGITGLVLDIDNTLTADGDPLVPEDIAQWLHDLRTAGIQAVILSNNRHARGEAFAALCGLPFVAQALKPSQRTLPRVLEILDADVAAVAVIGDQLFTDIWYGKRAKCTTVLVEKMGDDLPWFVRFKRKLEQPFFKKIRERGFSKL